MSHHVPTSAEILAFRGLIFDLDGTLVDSEPHHIRAWNEILGPLGVPPRDLNWVQSSGGKSTQVIAADLIAEYHLEGMDAPTLSSRKIATYIDKYLKEVPVFPAMAQLLHAARAHGCQIAVATGSRLPETEFLLRTHELSADVQAVVTSDQVRHGKPAPDTYLEAARRLGLTPAECLVFEDTEVGLQGIRAAGMCSIKVADGAFISGINRP